ncbi:MAG: PTS system mannose/fructose/sorbose family transporter subunit IID [Mediterraneibacter gnavus]
MHVHYERQRHMAFEYAMIPVINKLYDKEEDRIAAYERHMEFYSCQTSNAQPFICRSRSGDGRRGMPIMRSSIPLPSAP